MRRKGKGYPFPFFSLCAPDAVKIIRCHVNEINGFSCLNILACFGVPRQTAVAKNN